MIVIVDLEATCATEGDASFYEGKSEVIEVGACLIDDQCNVLSTFQTFIRPIHNPTLTAFCTELTGIQQADVTDAPGFVDAQSLMDQWLDHLKHEFGAIEKWGSWGRFDWNILHRNNRMHGNEPGKLLALEHINLKQEYAKLHLPDGISKSQQRKRVQPGVRLALKQQGMQFEGRPHRALDDAKNIARLCPVVFGLKPSRKSKVEHNYGQDGP